MSHEAYQTITMMTFIENSYGSNHLTMLCSPGIAYPQMHLSNVQNFTLMFYPKLCRQLPHRIHYTLYEPTHCHIMFLQTATAHPTSAAHCLIIIIIRDHSKNITGAGCRLFNFHHQNQGTSFPEDWQNLSNPPPFPTAPHDTWYMYFRNMQVSCIKNLHTVW